MTAIAELVRPASNTDLYTAMFREADGWRRDCLAMLDEIDALVADLLAELQPQRRRPGRSKAPEQPPFARLRELTGSKGPLAAQGKVISETLAELAPWCDWRTHLEHGVLTVWRGRGAQWLLALAYQPVPGDPVRTHAITWVEACAMRELVTKRIAALRSNARSLANAVSSKA